MEISALSAFSVFLEHYNLSRRILPRRMRNPSCLISCSQPGPEGGALAGDRKQGSIIPSSGPVRSRKVAVNRSVELIVQPGAKDAVGEMGVRGNLPAGYGNTNRCRHPK